MTISKHDLFCFFSGFSIQDVELHDYEVNLDRGLIILSCHNMSNYFLCKDDYIQLDGVLFQIMETSGAFFRASTTIELAENTSIMSLSVGSRLNLGVLAEKDLAHERLWMLQPSALGQASFLKSSVQDGHEYTLKLEFEASLELSSMIHQDSHLGLAGTSLTARDVLKEDGLIKFSIYCGRETREKTQFNERLPSGTQVNISEAAAIVDRTCL